MTTLLESISNRIRGKKRAQYDAKVCSVRTILVQTAHEELGLKVAHPVDENEALKIMEDTADVDSRQTVNCIKRRIGWAPKAENLDKFKAAAETAFAALATFTSEEAERRRLANLKLAELRQAEFEISRECAAAIQAHSELIATAEEHADEAALSSQLTELGRAIDSCKAALDRRGSPSASVVVAADARRGQLGGKLDKKRRDELERELTFYENATEERTKELASLEKQRDAIHAKLAKFQADKLRPENVRIIRKVTGE